MKFLSGDPPDGPDASILIPTRERTAKLSRCLEALANQDIPASRFEVIIGLDGPDESTEAAVGGARLSAQLVRCPRAGYMPARQAAFRAARGRIMISLNDDVEPAPSFVRLHLEAHAEAEARLGKPVIIVGDSPWKVHAGDTLFDRLVRETSMVFFYDQMAGPAREDQWRDWGFRHCWGLNFSVSTARLAEAGGFADFPLTYGYDDIEAGFRLAERFGMPVLFRPAAVAVHDHRYTPGDVLSREYQLGRAAWAFAGTSPAFGRAVFRRDIRSVTELGYSAEFVARERATAARLRASFLRLGELPAEAVAGSHGREVLGLVYEQHFLLKRWMWRAGLIDAAEGLENRPRYPEER